MHSRAAQAACPSDPTPPPPAAANCCPSPACLQRRLGYIGAGGVTGTLMVYRNDFKQLEFDLASATGEKAAWVALVSCISPGGPCVGWQRPLASRLALGCAWAATPFPPSASPIGHYLLLLNPPPQAP